MLESKDQSTSLPKRSVAVGSKAFWSALGAILAGAVVVLSQLATTASASEPRRGGRTGKQPSTLEEKIDDLRDDVKGIANEQTNQSRDIAVIKRQLGLDGLGPPPVRTSTIGR